MWRTQESHIVVDVVTPEKRSQMMSGIRGKDTKPEILIRQALHGLGFRYRLHDPRLPGKPDLSFAGRKAVIQVNGCFWHGHDCRLFKWPATRERFWKEKITSNKRRDRRYLRELSEMGWRTMIIWECALKGKGRICREKTIARAVTWLQSGIGDAEIRGTS